jgi:hypothetical protein
MPASTSERSNSQGVPNRPHAAGTVAWIIMAPLILASAMFSRPCRTQMIAFMVSGISVAIGLRSSATSCGDAPSHSPIVSNWLTKMCDATKMTASVAPVCHVGDGEDRPTWMGTVDFSGLKIKPIASIVAISAIALLRVFLPLGDAGAPVDSERVHWLVVIHLTFVVSGVLLAAMDWIASRVKAH